MAQQEALAGRICTGCREFKSAENFQPRGDDPTKTKLRSKCIQCKYGATVQRGKRRRPDARLPGATWKSHWEKNLFYNYGLSPDAYLAMLAGQNGVCAICRRQEPVPNRQLSVDHCHNTGHIRGLLCSLCNQGLGMFSDSQEILLAAIAYLKRDE